MKINKQINISNELQKYWHNDRLDKLKKTENIFLKSNLKRKK